jgi:hypothetical protein
MVEWRENPYPRTLPIELTAMLVITLVPLFIIILAIYFYFQHIALLVIVIMVPTLVVGSLALGLYHTNRTTPKEVGTSGFGVHLRYLNKKERMIPWNEILFLKKFKAIGGQPEVGVLIDTNKFIFKNSAIWGDNIGVIMEKIESGYPKQKPLTEQITWMDNSLEKSEKGFYWSSAAIFTGAFAVFAFFMFYSLLKPGIITAGEFLIWIALFVGMILLGNLIVYVIIRYHFKFRPKKVGFSKNGIHLSYKGRVEDFDWVDVKQTKFHLGDGFPNSPLVGRIRVGEGQKEIILRFEITHEIERYKISLE